MPRQLPENTKKFKRKKPIWKIGVAFINVQKRRKSSQKERKKKRLNISAIKLPAKKNIKHVQMSALKVYLETEVSATKMAILLRRKKEWNLIRIFLINHFRFETFKSHTQEAE